MSRDTVFTSVSVGLATGLYGVSFGALATASGFSLLDAMLLSLLMFSGASQFAFISIAPLNPIGAIGAAWLLGVRNGFYGLRMSPLLGALGLRKVLASQLTIDESTGVALAQPEGRLQRLGFWATGVAVFVFWNTATFIGAVIGDLLGDPSAWGLDAAAAAAFLALLWPRLSTSKAPQLSIAAVLLALISTPILPPGVPILLAALVAAVPYFWRKS
jgi:predicted branched-subunit amino acid permease